MEESETDQTNLIIIPSRISYNGDICSVKYIGNLPSWPNEIALGVEWDNPYRGKHSGIFNSTQYFECRVPGAGSFVKSSRPKDQPRSLLEAIQYRYSDDYVPTSVSQIKFGSKVAQEVGFEEISKKHSELQNLTYVSVARLCVQTSSPGLSSILQNVNTLDLSGNLIAEILCIADICKQLPTLRTLILNDNRFAVNKTAATIGDSFKHIENLSLGATLITADSINKLSKLFSNLKELCLHKNRLQDFILPSWNSLSSLDLSYNELTSIPDSLLHIKNLDLKHNKIKDSGIPDKNSKYYMIEKMDLSENQINNLNTIIQLGVQFPFLKDIRLNGNPVYEKYPKDVQRYITIPLLPQITSLDGSEIKMTERQDAEIFFVNKVRFKVIDIDLNSDIWKNLSLKYKSIIENTKISNTLSSQLIEVEMLYEDKRIKKKLPKTLLISRLESLARILFNLEAGSVSLYLASKTINENNNILDPNTFKTLEYYGIEGQCLIEVLDEEHTSCV